MPVHVDERAGEHLGEVVALVEVFAATNGVREVRGHKFASDVVFGVVAEDVGVRGPILVELRGELDEVARDGGAGQAGVVGGREQTMQCVAELVEEGDDLVEGKEGGAACDGLRNVGDVVDDRQGLKQARLVNERRHPGTAVLVVALEGIEVEEGEGLVVHVGELEDADGGMIDGDVVALAEGDAEELSGGEEDALLKDGVELEVRFQRFFVERVAGLANLLGVELPVPGSERERVRLRVDEGLDIASLCGDAFFGLDDEIAQEERAASGVLAIWSCSFQAA